MKITSYKKVGLKQVYNLRMKNEPHNYILPSGIVSKNSHSISYSFVTYATAYLKANYTLEFIAAFLIQEAGNQDQVIKCMSECKRLGIEVKPPHINKSEKSFTLTDDNKIVFGLGPIKNLGIRPVEVILDERKNGPFTSLKNFCERVDLSVINSLKLSSLIKAGAFDGLGPNRASMLKNIDEIWKYNKTYKAYTKKLETYYKKITLYEERLQDIEEGKTNDKGKPLKLLKEPVRPEAPVFPKIKEIDEDIDFKLQTAEYELLGLYITSHPLENIDIPNNCYTIEDMKSMTSNSRVKMVGIVSQIQEITTRTKKQKMAMITIEDLTGTIDAVIFTKTYADYHHLLNERRPLIISAVIDTTELDEESIIKLRVSKLESMPINIEQNKKYLTVKIPIEKTNEALTILNKYKGDVHTLYIYFILKDGSLVRAKQPLSITNAYNAFQKEINKLCENL